MNVVNIRLGFATNSSSTHSVIVMPNQRDDIRPLNACYYYGWDNFILSSTRQKMKYLLAQVKCNEDNNEHRVDHQSVWAMPDPSTKAGQDYINCLKTLIEKEDVIILGGNDNSDPHPLYNEEKEIPLPIYENIRKNSFKAIDEKRFTFVAYPWMVEKLTKTSLDSYDKAYEVEVNFTNVIPEYKILRPVTYES